MAHGRQADRRLQRSASPARPLCRDVADESVLLFEEALAGLQSGERPDWLPAWAFRKARAVAGRRKMAQGWIGGHLGFVEDLAMREACFRHGLAPAPEAPPEPSTMGAAVALWRFGADRHPEAGYRVAIGGRRSRA